MRRPHDLIVTVAAVLLIASACTFSTASSASQGLPQAAPGTALRAVQDRGKIIAGVAYKAPTFGMLNPATNQPEGFEIDLVRAVAAHVLGDPKRVEFREVSGQARITELQDGKVDLVAAIMTVTEERSQIIDFSDVYYVAGQGIMVPKSSTVNGIEGLAGKRVGTNRETTSAETLRRRAQEVGFEALLFTTYAEAVAAMDEGKLDAVSYDDAVLFGYIKTNADKYRIAGATFTVEPYAMGVAKGKIDLLNAVNQALRTLIDNGTWAKLYEQHLPVGKAPPPPARYFPPVHR